MINSTEDEGSGVSGVGAPGVKTAENISAFGAYIKVKGVKVNVTNPEMSPKSASA
jgi:hypothetical protein